VGLARKNTGIFYFSQMIKFANSAFIFAIRGPKLARLMENIALNRGLFFTITPQETKFTL